MKKKTTVEGVKFRRYLLGDCSATEMQRIEWNILTEDGTADLLAALEDELIEEYLAGELNRRDHTLFEQRFLTNDEKVGQVLLTEALLQRLAFGANKKLGGSEAIADDTPSAMPFDQRYLERLRSGDSLTELHFITYFSERFKSHLLERTVPVEEVEAIEAEALSRTLLLLSGGWNEAIPLESLVMRTYQEAAFGNPETRARGKYGAAVGNSKRGEHSSDPGAIVIATKENRQKLKRTLDSLPEKDRRLLKAIFFENQDKEVACREVGVTGVYLRILIHRVKKRLQGA